MAKRQKSNDWLEEPRDCYKLNNSEADTVTIDKPGAYVIKRRKEHILKDCYC